MDAAPSYPKLLEHAKSLPHLKQLLENERRTDALSFEHGGIFVDLSRQNATRETFELLLDLADARKRILKRGPLLHQLLGLLGIVPEVGIFSELVQLSEACRRFLDVKDASSAARPTA